MCELFGYSGARPLDVSPYLRMLASHSPDHPHGWGIAAIYGKYVNLEKEPKPAWVSDYLRNRLEYPLEVPAVIAHIRLATRGSMSHPNCHPFVMQDAANRTWTLAHNGTIFESDILDAYRDIQIGGTDSERILCHIIHKSDALPVYASNPAFCNTRFEMVDNIIQEIAQHNKLNLLIHDGEYLYVHTNMANTLYRKSVAEGTLFATVPLDEGGWEPVPMMQLLVYADGRLIFEGTKHSFEYHKPDDPDGIQNWVGL